MLFVKNARSFLDWLQYNVRYEEVSYYGHTTNVTINRSSMFLWFGSYLQDISDDRGSILTPIGYRDAPVRHSVAKVEI